MSLRSSLSSWPFFTRVLLACIAAAFFVSFVFLYQAYLWYQDQPWEEDLSKILHYQTGQSTFFYDVHGNLIQESYSAYQKHKSFKELPRALIESVVAIEDQNFFHHRGIDMRAIVRAAYENLRAGRIVQGGSTITQQLVRSYLLNRDRLFSRKIREAILALKLEKRLSKEQILERYLNHLFLGQNSYGVAGAAKRFFSKPLKDLKLHQHALLAGLFQAPSRYNPLRHEKLAHKRSHEVLRALYHQGKISEKTFLAARKRPMNFKASFGTLSDIEAHHLYYIDFVTTQAQKFLGVRSLKDKGYRIHTYLDLSSSDLLRDSIQAMDMTFERVQRMNTLPGGEPPRLEAAGMIMNVKKGTVEAMVGGRDYHLSHFNRAVQAQRALGSAFKPVVYSYGLSQGYDWSDVFYISPITLADTYRPRSPSHQYLKESTLLQSFFSSINVTSLELGKKLGMKAVAEHGKRLGIHSPIKMEYGSLIGQSEVNLFEITRMYSTFAGGGKRVEPVVVARIEDSQGNVLYEATDIKERQEEVLSSQVNYLMVEGMRKVLSHGTGRKAHSLAAIAGGKTGTTNDATNNWFCGFTQDYVVVIWVGTDSSEPLLRGSLSGAKLALPIWRSVMDELSKKAGTLPMPAPPGLVQARIDPRFGHQSATGVSTWFLKGTVPSTKPSTLTLIDSGSFPLRGFGSSGEDSSL